MFNPRRLTSELTRKEDKPEGASKLSIKYKPSIDLLYCQVIRIKLKQTVDLMGDREPSFEIRERLNLEKRVTPTSKIRTLKTEGLIG